MTISDLKIENFSYFRFSLEILKSCFIGVIILDFFKKGLFTFLHDLLLDFPAEESVLQLVTSSSIIYEILKGFFFFG